MGKIVFAVTDNKSVWVNRSRCLISDVNVVILLIKILVTVNSTYRVVCLVVTIVWLSGNAVECLGYFYVFYIIQGHYSIELRALL
jgi:hypothetical protein